MNTNNADTLQSQKSSKLIHSITPFTLLDFPDKTACIVWFAGCNMKCSYCYNPEVVFGKGKLSVEDLMVFLRKRIGLIDGIVLSGGECTLYKEIYPLAEQVKALGFLFKIDTNGSNPDLLSSMIKNRLVDYVALDFKAPENKYQHITALSSYHSFLETLGILLKSETPFEVRTTFHSALLDKADITEMLEVLKQANYKGYLYVQAFRNGVQTIQKGLGDSLMPSDIESLSNDDIQIVLR